MFKSIFTPRAPSPIGPYSQAVCVDQLLFISGQIALDPATGELVSGSIADQTHRVLENITAIVESAGADLTRVVKTTIFLKDLKNFGEVNRVYSEYFGQTKPARSTVEVSALPKGAELEIEAVAVLIS